MPHRLLPACLRRCYVAALLQVRQNTEMESHEEKLHKMIIQVGWAAACPEMDKLHKQPSPSLLRGCLHAAQDCVANT